MCSSRVQSQESGAVIGIDFSGAKDAGRKIWLSIGSVVDRQFQLERVFRITDLTGGVDDRASAHTALRGLIAGSRDAIVGCDFPFSLPADLVEARTWRLFALEFGLRYPDAETFRDLCRTALGGRDVRRVTEAVTRTPFSSYNLRIYRQTYYGLRDVLAPLVAEDRAVVVPMMLPIPGKAIVLEACPASALKRLGLNMSYKGRGSSHRRAREVLLDALLARGDLAVSDSLLRETMVRDNDGDALDSFIAAAITHWAALQADNLVTDDPLTRIEGRVYM